MEILTDPSAMTGRLNLGSICHNMAEYSAVAIVALEGNTNTVQYFNPAFRRLIGERNKSIVGKHFFDAVPGAARKGCSEMFGRVFNTRVPESLEVKSNADSDGRDWVYSSWIVLGLDNVPAGIVVQMTEMSRHSVLQTMSAEMNQALLLSSIKLTDQAEKLTDQAEKLTDQAEKLSLDLKKATQVKSQFLVTMSHEIRTPLTAIAGFAEMLGFSEVNIEDRRLFGDCIRRNSCQLLKLVDDIMDLSKIEVGELSVTRSKIDIDLMLSGILLVLKGAADAKNIELSIAIDHSVPKIILCDADRLNQILVHIIGNAIKFTASGSVRIGVNYNSRENLLHIKVIDTGIGISWEERLNLFRLFTQVDSTLTRKFGGTGIGLDLSRKLARFLGGDVKLLESIVGEGSVFDVTIEIFTEVPRSSEESGGIGHASLESRLDQIHVLLAEDARDNQFLITEYLTGAGATVEIAENGEEAIEMAKVDFYDIILMDILMPKVDGYLATSRILDAGYKGPIIALTAHGTDDDFKRSKEAGFAKFMTKPISRIALVNAIAELVPKYGVRSGAFQDLH